MSLKKHKKKIIASLVASAIAGSVAVYTSPAVGALVNQFLEAIISSLF